MFFVAGITGHVGGAAARQLLKQGHRVRTLHRDPQKLAEWTRQGVEVRPGDLNDASAVAGALSGVEGAFLLMLPTMAPSPGYPEARATIASYTQALRHAPPPRLVALSSFGSEKTSGLGNITATSLMEQAMGSHAFPTAFIRAGGFMENYAYIVKMAQATGSFDMFAAPTSKKFPLIATQDIGMQVARLLAEGWTGKKIVELGSLYSPDDLAIVISSLIKRPVQARAVPREQWSKALEHMGVPAGRTGPFEEMMDGINSGWINFGAPGGERVEGTTTPAQFYAGVMTD